MLIFVHDITSLLILNISQRAVVATTMHPFEIEPNIFGKSELASRQARCFSQQLSLYQISSGTSQEDHAIAIGIQTIIEHKNEKKVKSELQQKNCLLTGCSCQYHQQRCWKASQRDGRSRRPGGCCCGCRCHRHGPHGRWQPCPRGRRCPGSRQPWSACQW